MGVLDVVGLPALMALSSGRRDIVVGLLDGPVSFDHAELTGARIQEIPGVAGRCAQAESVACRHGTFVAGILIARRDSVAPAICPDCSLLTRPIFTDSVGEGGRLPSAAPEQVAVAIRECVAAGAWVLNLSAATGAPSTRAERQLHEALDDAARHGVLLVAAAGNQGTLGSSAITRHPGVIPVVGYGADGRLMATSNLGSSVGKRGVGAPGENVTSLVPQGEPVILTGTSFAAAIVTGAVALLWSLFPHAPAVAVKSAVLSAPLRRRSVVPPLLDAVGAYQLLSQTQGEPV